MARLIKFEITATRNKAGEVTGWVLKRSGRVVMRDKDHDAIVAMARGYTQRQNMPEYGQFYADPISA